MESVAVRINRLRFSYLGFQIAFALLFWLPVFYEFQKRLGLDDRQILGIQSIYYIAFCLFEFPTGFLADRMGRRLCARIGAGLLLFANLIGAACADLPELSQRGVYWGMLVHFLGIALARSFVSGAASAYLYDSLASEGRTSDYASIEGKARAYGVFTRVLGWIGIGALMELRLSLPYWLTVGSGAAALAFALALPHGGEAATEKPGRATGIGLPTLFSQLRHTPQLALTMIQGIAIFVMDRICLVNLFQPILNSKQFSVVEAGPMLAWVSACEALGAASVRRFSIRVAPGSHWKILLGLTGVMGLSLGSMGLDGTTRLMTIGLFTIYALAAGLAYPLQRQAMNDAIPDSRNRATLISVESLLDRSVCAVIAWILGDYLQRGQIDRFLLLTGAGTLAFVASVYSVRKFGSQAGDQKKNA